MTPAEIQLLFSTAGTSGLGGHDDQEQARRTISLQQALLSLQQYWVSRSEQLDLAAEYLADGSRDPSWRIPIGESGILAFFLGLVSTDQLRPRLKVHTLRLIGNSCADEDANRARVVAGNYLQHIVALLVDDSVLAFVIPVLFNVCVDYEPAQAQAGQAHLSRALAVLVDGPRLTSCRAFLTIICKILGLLVRKEPETSLVDLDTPVHLLRFAVRPDAALDAEEFYYLISVILTCLSHESFQAELNKQAAVETLLTVFADSYAKYDTTTLDPEDLADFQQVRTRFTSIIADVMAEPTFFNYYGITSPLVQTLEAWLRDSSTDVHLQTAACYALGNLARSDATSTYFVHTDGLHQYLFRILSTPAAAASSSDDNSSSTATASSQLHYAVISFLRNLAIPPPNKPVLGALLDPPMSILPRFWTVSAAPHIQFAAISLSRLLVASCPTNVRRICAPLSTDPSSPAHQKSNLHVLADVFGRIDDENTKTEAARVIATVCRVLHSTPHGPPILSDDWEPTEPKDSATVNITETSPASASSFSTPAGVDGNALARTSVLVHDEDTPVHEQARRAHFYEALLDMASAFSYLMTQTRYLALRSEIIFICALMSCSTDGARLVMRTLHPIEAWRVIVEVVSGRDMVDGHDLEVTGGEPSGLLPAPPTDAPDYSMLGNGLTPQPVNPAHAEKTARSDRENGIVLLSEILKKYADFMPPFRRNMFEQTLQAGSQLVQQAKEQEAQAFMCEHLQ